MKQPEQKGRDRDRKAEEKRNSIPVWRTLILLLWEYSQAKEKEEEVVVEKEETNKWREEKMNWEDTRWWAGRADQSVNIHSTLLSKIKY